MISSDETADLSKFGGLDRFEWVQKEMIRLVETQEFMVTPHIKILNDYNYGVGLEGVIDVPVINSDTINDFITQFIENGEKLPNGVPVLATTDMMDATTHMFSNAII